jgi:predicted DNA-binding transcriptional regulator AlpA
VTEDRIIWRRDLRAALTISDESLRRMLKSGRLPKPDIDLSNRTKGWKVSTLKKAGINLILPEEAPPVGL